MSVDQMPVVALVGNPNVGKSTVFNALTGMRQHTGNWPGKTVASARGVVKHGTHAFTLVDLPGTYSLLAQSPDEEITRDFIQSGKADCTIVVADATCLERNLALILQVTELTPKVIVCLNLMDEAYKKGIRIRIDLLEEKLGVPVIPCAAARGKGLRALCRTVWQCIVEKKTGTPPALRYPEALSDPALPEERRVELKTAALLFRAEEICNDVLFVPEDANARDRALDRVLTGRRCGIPVMLLLLAGVLFLTIWGANIPSEVLAKLLFAISNALSSGLLFLHAPSWLHGLLIDGVWNILSTVISVMLPPMAIFFPLFTLLEDAGYLPRVAYNLDHAFCKAKTCGKQALTMCMGLGCNAAGVIGCRIIDSPRERLIAILTNSMVPCNGRFPTMISLLTIFFIGSTALMLHQLVFCALGLTALIALGVLATLLSSRILSMTILRGIPSSFALELPPYRRPQVGRVIVRSVFDRTLFVLARAAAVAAPAGALIWILANLSIGEHTILHLLAGWLDPIGRFLGLDGMILLAFLLGFPANEIVMPIVLMGYMTSGTLVECTSLADLGTLLLANGWTVGTALCFLVFSLFHWPCSTTCLTIWKETGRFRWVLAAVFLPTIIGCVLCALLAHLPI